ncbi:MAG TPA: NAD(P)-binding domain-containing protein [Actinomycetota bacterium]|nr:NAD(P)-binding domain-containing protein [Actinomycetota bacterium]
MNIAIVGAGHIGGTLTRRLSALGHQVTVANSRGPESLAALVEETGARAAYADQAARGADLVIITIPEGRVPDLPAGLLTGLPAETPVVDTGNYYPRRDGRIEAIEGGMAESRWVATQLGRDVIKAFNTIASGSLLADGKPAGTPGRIALPVAGDDAAAKATVMALVDQLGFDPVDAGGLDDSWRQQPGAPVYAANRDAAGVQAGLAVATRLR